MRPPQRRVNYKIRDKVEVCSKEEGFVGSYFKATIVLCLQNEKFVVRYENLLLDDESEPLTEIIYRRELRPLPPRVRNSTKFHFNQKVDVFDNDGWWLGEITSEKILLENYYYYKVYDKMPYTLYRIPNYRCNIADSVVSASASYCNCGVI
ncbi:protein AGENET DOMAIN (AGD)-CONTAINING P1-like [Lathyrus oleraceus]|uniref:protein AGENET DOMAIN (AGD)-CONTAINING P1-like n=1 Tax=Pisum sativum TaxID=3888 RepID=UPI0021D355AE|nr:protein AGENET DOMAIN (AGD)-CONTAINING P1-like [Pisum sativum]